MKITPRILLLEDNVRDADLLRARLQGEGFDCKLVVVSTKEEFKAAIAQEQWEVVVSDYSLPDYDGLSALSLTEQKLPGTPFIFFSGTLGEEKAVESLKSGAADYILKSDARRLVPALRRALADVEDRAMRRQTQEALRESEERFAKSFRALSVGLSIARLSDGCFLEVNDAFLRLFGFQREEVLCHTALELGLWPNSQRRQELIARLQTEGSLKQVEAKARMKSGKIGDMLMSMELVEMTGVKCILGVFDDITERKQAEERIRELAELLDKAQDAIYVCDLEDRITYWNKGSERIYGWSSAEANREDANQLLVKGDSPQLDEIRQKVMERGEWSGELSQVAKDGKPVIVESRWTLVGDDAGKPKARLVINTDITERKKLEAQFLRLQRMESIGALAGGIAHDLNNVLAPIMMGVELLRDEMPSGEKANMLRTMRVSAQRGAELVNQILAFARGVSVEPGLLDLKHLVTDIKRLTNETFPRSISFQTELTKELYPVRGNATQLHQVLLNLCINARDAMPDGGSLRIKAASVVLDKKINPSQRVPVSGPHVVLIVSDTGQGMPPAVLKRIFEPFFTTKDIGKGTGLGLSTVQGIVKTHGGFLEVASEVGKGTTFKIYLPAVAEASTKPAEAKPPVLRMGRGEQILVVDDEISILEMTREMLGTYNYRVLTANDGAEAVAMYQRHKEEIHLVMTDMMMPIMDGPTTMHVLQKINPHVKIIGVSGLGSESALARVGKLKVQAYLRKPYTTEELLATLQSVLQEK